MRRLATFAERLTRALERDGRSNRAIAAAIRAKGGVKITHAYISQLAKGIRPNPSLEHTRALAAELGVPINWLAGEDVPAGQPSPELDETALHIAARSTGLSELSLEMIRQMIETARKAEGLPHNSP